MDGLPANQHASATCADLPSRVRACTGFGVLRRVMDRLVRNQSFLNRSARTLARARIGTRALAAHRQATAVPQAAIGAKVDQPLDADADLATQVTLDREPRDFLAQLFHLTF